MKAKLLWVAIATLATIGCTKTDNLSEADTKQLIGFSAPQIGKQSKAPISGTVYPTNLPFGVFSYLLTENKTWETEKSSATVMMNNLEISYQNPVWKASGANTYYWPADAGSSLSFICYSPKSTTGVSYDLNNGDGLTVIDYVNDGSTDLMYSNEIANQTYSSASGVVAPQFNHALTQVYFTAKTASDYTDATVTIKSIKFNNIISKGSFKANPTATATWALDGATIADYTAYENSTGHVVTNQEVNVGSALVMIPQADLTSQAQTVTVVYEVKGSGITTATATKKLTLEGEWARNAKVKYQLTITLTEIVYSPTINDWDQEGIGATN